MYKITLLRTKPKYDCEQNMNIQDEIANNGDTTIQANSAAKGVTSVSFAPGRISQYRRRRRRRSVECKPSTDPDRLCTNTYCKTRRTPLWRKGPLGPKVNSEQLKTHMHLSPIYVTSYMYVSMTKPGFLSVMYIYIIE